MLSGCELIDTKNISLPCQNMKFVVEWASYSVDQADIFQYQSYSHSDGMCIILKSNINTDTSIGFDICIFVGKIARFKILKIRFPKTQFISSLQIYHSFLQVYINVKIVEFSPLMVIFIFFMTNTVGNRFHPFSLKVLFTNDYDVKIMTSKQRLSRIVSSTFL